MAKGGCARRPGIGDVAGEVIVVDEDTTRVAELELAPRQALHWHWHTNFDRMYCSSGTVVVETRMPPVRAPRRGQTPFSRKGVRPLLAKKGSDPFFFDPTHVGQRWV